MLTLFLAWASAADEPAALTGSEAGGSAAPASSGATASKNWGDIALYLKHPDAGDPAAATPSLSQQLRTLSEGLARFDGAPDATGALPFADLRSGDTHLIARHPLLSGGYESGTGAVSQPIALAPHGIPLALELGHVKRSSLTLAANAHQAGAQIEDRSFTQIVASLGDPSSSQLSFVLGRSEELRRQTAGYAYEDPYGFYVYGPYGGSNRAGEADTTGLALDWSLFSGKALLKAGYARSVYSAPESPLAVLGFDDPLAQLAAPPEEGDARYLDVSLTPWSGEDGLIQFRLKHSESEEEFSGDDGWNFFPGGTEQSIAAEGRWRALSFRAERREKEDLIYSSSSSRLSADAHLYLDWLDLSLSRSFYESTSEFPYWIYVYGDDPEDPYAGMWVPGKIRNTRVSDSASGAASLRGEAWSVDLDWSRSQGAYRYGRSAESTQEGQHWTGSASYDFGLIGMQALLSQSDELYGFQPRPVVTSRTEGGITLSLDFDGSGHDYGSSYDGGYYGRYGGYGSGDYEDYGRYGGYGGYGRYGGYSYRGPEVGSYDGYDPAQFPWLARGGVTYPNGATGYAFPQTKGLRAPLPPAPHGARTQGADESFFSHFLPSRARIGLRQGVAREEDGDDGTTGLPPVFSDELISLQGPYHAVEGGLGWKGPQRSTDLSLRVTLASGDEEHYAGGISYEAELSHRIWRGPIALGASLQGAVSRFQQLSAVDSELYALASVDASYTLDWLAFDARAHGVRRETRYSQGQPYSSSFGSLQLGVQMNFDASLPAAWRRAKAPPYLRLRGYYERIYADTAYEAGLTSGAGVILVGGLRF